MAQARVPLRIALKMTADTLELGESIGRAAESGLVIALMGTLGAGKTTFVQGLAEGLGNAEWTSSPTFALATVYERGRLPLFHLDLYRLGDGVLQELDWLDEYLFSEGVCAVEWSELLGASLPEDVLQVTMAYDADGSGRTADIGATGPVALRVAARWADAWRF